MARGVKRSYVSPQREAQAEATRRSILDAALELFTGSGYVATTMQAVADQAGVAVQTVYAVFGNKRELLRSLLETSVTGDTSSEPLSEDPGLRRIADEPDPRRRAAMDAAWTAEISRRLAPIMTLLREAATSDPDFAATMEKIKAQRRVDMAAAATALAGPGGQIEDLERTIGTLYVLYSPDAFIALTNDLGWSIEQYETWLAEMLYRTAIAPE